MYDGVSLRVHTLAHLGSGTTSFNPFVANFLLLYRFSSISCACLFQQGREKYACLRKIVQSSYWLFNIEISKVVSIFFSGNYDCSGFTSSVTREISYLTDSMRSSYSNIPTPECWLWCRNLFFFQDFCVSLRGCVCWIFCTFVRGLFDVHVSKNIYSW